MRSLFTDEDGNRKQPLVRGSTAGLNSAKWYSCPECGASIVEMQYSTDNRDIHQAWHDNQEVNS